MKTKQNVGVNNQADSKVLVYILEKHIMQCKQGSGRELLFTPFIIGAAKITYFILKSEKD
jgi:hypothetical protein